MIRIHHKIIKKGKCIRSFDKYTIYYHCLFRKRVKYLFIGLNPAASNDEFTDNSNLWIINWIIANDKSGGYYLTNLFKDISSIYSSSKKIINEDLDEIIERFPKHKICLFYGKNIITKNGLNLNATTIKLIKKAYKEKRLFMTSQNGDFRHISHSNGSLNITEVIDLSSIGIKE